MTTLLHLAEHYTFLHWFEKIYPQLNSQYGAGILPAIDDNGFTIRAKDTEREICAMLQQIINDYNALFRR